MKPIVHVTISDCRSERRIFNQAFSGKEWGYPVKIVALKTPAAPSRETIRGVSVERISITHPDGGPRKFLEFNFRAFKFLLKTPASLIHAHDLWVLPATALAAQIKRLPLVYDAHEFYRGLRIFQEKPISGLLWQQTESLLIRRVNALIAVNAHHQRLYRKLFPNVPSLVLLNVPHYLGNTGVLPYTSRPPVIIYQGLFRPGRGLEHIIPAYSRVSQGELWFVGTGELEEQLKSQAKEFGIEDRVTFWGFQPYDRILSLTQQARAGLVLFRGDHINYRYASPNKFFEYVQAGTPVIATDIPTFRQFFTQFQVGDLVDENELTDHLAQLMQKYITDPHYGEHKHQQCLQARKVWNWEEESSKLKQLYRSLLSGKNAPDF